MAMNLGGSGTRAEINLTPMIDVLLVLLILFMVITPVQSVGLPTNAPQPSPPGALSDPTPGTLVIDVRGNGLVEVNTRPVAVDELQQRLMTEFHARPQSPVFIQADSQLEFHEVARVIDITRGAGIPQVGLMPGRVRR